MLKTVGIASFALFGAAALPRPGSAPPAPDVAIAVSREAGAVAGTVLDAAARTPLNGASISVKGTSLRASTDGDGSFLIEKVPLGGAILNVARVGYVSREISVSVTAEGTAQWTIVLSPAKR